MRREKNLYLHTAQLGAASTHFWTGVVAQYRVEHFKIFLDMFMHNTKYRVQRVKILLDRAENISKYFWTGLKIFQNISGQGSWVVCKKRAARQGRARPNLAH